MKKAMLMAIALALVSLPGTAAARVTSESGVQPLAVASGPCVTIVADQPPVCPVDEVKQTVANVGADAQTLAAYAGYLAATYTTITDNTEAINYDASLTTDIASGAAGVAVDEDTQGIVRDCLYTVQTANGPVALRLSTTSGPCGGANRNERCYSSTVTVTAQYPVTHSFAWSARLYKTWCGIPGLKITSQDASTDSTIGTCWSGPQNPQHKTKTYTRTHAETTMFGQFTFQCGFAWKTMQLNAGVEFWSNGSRKKFNRTQT